MPKTKSDKKRTKRTKEVLSESQYKTINGNPEVFSNEKALVSEVKENMDGSATIQLEFTQEQRDMLFDVCIRNVLVNGLKSIDKESEEYSNELKLRSVVIDQVRLTLEAITLWETSDDVDWVPRCAGEVQILREMMAKL